MPVDSGLGCFDRLALATRVLGVAPSVVPLPLTPLPTLTPGRSHRVLAPERGMGAGLERLGEGRFVSQAGRGPGEVPSPPGRANNGLL